MLRMAIERRRWMWIGVLVGTLLTSVTRSVAEAQIKLEITGEGGRTIPIAVAPLIPLSGGSESQLTEEFTRVITRDLDLSGYFQVLDSSRAEAPEGGVTPESINFQQWADLGALALVKGGFLFEGNSLVLEVRLFDVAQRKQLGGKRYRGERRELRRMVHRFADQILLMLTGELGPFDSRIAFVSTRGGNGRAKELYITDLSGTQISAVTRDRSLSLSPGWSPSANRIGYCSYRRGGPYPYVFNLQDNEPTQLIASVGYSGGRWSPDGSRIAASLEQEGNSDLFLLSPEGRVIRQLTERSGINISPTWSPDGQSLAFCSNRGGGPQIYILNVNSGNIRRLTFRGDYNTSPSWSPKGDTIAYTTRSGGFRILTISVRGGEPKEIAPGEDPSWSPDGRYLVFSTRGRLRLARKDGYSVKQLTGGGGDDTSPAWSPRLE
jgi:TolB protein